MPRVAVIGLDAAEWTLIEPLMASGSCRISPACGKAPLDRRVFRRASLLDPRPLVLYFHARRSVGCAEVAYVPWGEWVQPTAFRKNVHGVLKFTAPIFWNVRVA
jgi:hypothetical protein